MKRLTHITLSIILALLMFIVFYVPAVNKKVAELYQAEVAERKQLDRDLLAEAPTDFTVGAKDPSLRLVVYTDTDCPFCAKMEPRFDRLLASYPDEVAITYRHFDLPIYPGSHYEHLVLECVGVLHDAYRYRDFQNTILFNNKFESDDEENHEKAIILADRYWDAIAPDLAFGVSECVHDQATAERVERKTASGSTLGVRQTPTIFYVDREGNYKMQSGSLPYDQLLAAINEFLGAEKALGSRVDQ